MIALSDLDMESWATCGPVSLAALLEVPVSAVRDAFPAQRNGRSWTNLTQMRAAIRAMGRTCQDTPNGPLNLHVVGETRTPAPVGCRVRRLPRHGLAWIFWRGPWDDPAVPFGAKAQRSHWIATRLGAFGDASGRVFDINLVGTRGACLSGWTSFDLWATQIAPALADAHRRATGAWWCYAGLEVTP